MVVFPLYKITEYCPPGWRGTKTVCLKTVENGLGLGTVNYRQAAAICHDLDPIAYPMSPYNDDLNNELKTELSNSSLTESEFWIGKKLE